ncbi:MAG: ATP-binding cassette domain-containing protein [Lachnospiraceae bacterium]|nr:ATP-binding cassette domain-containing protein [Lachnospiraceae bacterium]
MAFLQLKNIGKIYVSEGAVAVGIRGVNLSFDQGEFVAITGASGSGKSTLLNVISGMDTYEEGEMFVDGKPTSHYIQSDWEEYREKYISFIFQDYNIIESFTVLQNVELALMNIRNPIERRRRAIELLERVGLKSHLKQKGSRLSGGQKQRCVIARALAKDSPIILADEPTGNLDAQSSKEIIELLKEVSKDKLLIVVTHDFDEVEAHATRHIRVFDGAVESDQRITESEQPVMDVPVADSSAKSKDHVYDVRNGLRLGWASYLAKPKLTFFICFILFLGIVGSTFITGALEDAFAMFGRFYMFTPSKGRVIISKYEAADFTESELRELVKKYGAESYFQNDAILDAPAVLNKSIEYNRTRLGETERVYESVYFGATTEHFGRPDIGRYPDTDDDEILLYVPLCHKAYFDGYLDGSNSAVELQQRVIQIGTTVYDVVGVKYYIDNTKQAQIVMTDKAYRKLSAYVSSNWNAFKDLKENTSLFYSTSSMIDNLLHGSDKIYNQASLYFKSNSAAKKAAKTIREDGYLACHSKQTYNPDILSVIERVMVGGLSFLLWLGAIAFLVFFVNLCTHRSLDVIKSDLTIFRSMGISVRVIKLSMFFRMYISIIPGMLVTLIGLFVLYHLPDYNNMIRYLHWYEYLFVIIGILIITTWVTRKQIHRLFEESVKKTLKGGAEA